MFAIPDVDEVVSVGESLGLHLGSQEAVLFQKYLDQQLALLDQFVQARIDEAQPTLSYPAREPGAGPAQKEDPLNAWLWKCNITGAADGALAGKTVSFKDHIAVAGVPLTFGSFVLEGFIPDFDATVVSRTLAAGGTIVGKQAMNGFAGGFGFGGGIGDYGRPKNPHNPEHVTGGPASGSGAGVPAGGGGHLFG